MLLFFDAKLTTGVCPKSSRFMSSDHSTSSNPSANAVYQTPGGAMVRLHEKKSSLATHTSGGLALKNAEKCLIPTVKYVGGSLMLWGYFASIGPGVLVKFNGIMNFTKYQGNWPQVDNNIPKK